ncbi:YeeE/YedE family protein [Microbacterium album]|uniref:Membrane protein n=1 Tax=Microbacterium album TaxID=2053191 RepID=A0A917IGH8_9MICO|nr:YeeE/YedE family protein [Microbacterium album]GGH46793.1 membrane protein [Microbacterium album]
MSQTVVDGGAPTPGGAAAPRTLGWTRADTVRTVIAVAIAIALLVAAAVLYQVRSGTGTGPTASFALLAGAGLGILFERGRFCFYCIFRDLFEKRDSRGAYSILTALAVGSVGYALVLSMRVPDPQPGTVPPGAFVGPVGPALVIGGFAFGLGIVISGGCIAGHLYRLGEGSLRALPALAGAVVGFGLGYATWNPIASALIVGAPVPWLPSAFGYGPALALQLAALAAIGVLLLRWNPPVRERPARVITATEVRRQLFFQRWPALLTGGLVGILGVLAYLRGQPLGVTAQLGSSTRTGLTEAGWIPESLIGLDGALAGCVALVVETLTDNGWLVIGILLGSFAAALPGRRFRIERLTVRGAGTAVLGGTLLGWGATLSLGCTIGVFLSGTQAFALSGWVFAAAVVAALALGFRLGWHRS